MIAKNQIRCQLKERVKIINLIDASALKVKFMKLEINIEMLFSIKTGL